MLAGQEAVRLLRVFNLKINRIEMRKAFKLISRIAG